MNILITGGAGFIGSCFVRHVLKKHPDYKIINLDALTYCGNLENLEDIEDNPNYTFVKGDIQDEQLVDELVNGVDYIVHFAAESHVDNSIKNPGLFLNTNIIGTQVLLENAKKYKIKRYHQISTDEVYGDLPLDRPDLLFTEETPIHTSSPYSASKASADLLVMAYHRTFGLPVTISRCSNNYGPYHFPEKLIPLMIANALNDKPLPVYGKGENVRDWLYVEDHCEAIDLIIRLSFDTYESLFYQMPEKQRMLFLAIAREGKVKEITGGTFVRKHKLISSSSVNSAFSTRRVQSQLPTRQPPRHAIRCKHRGDL